MGKRVKLQFDRNPDVRTEYYYVYRSVNPNVTRRSTRVVKVAQIHTPNPIHAKDRGITEDGRIYRFPHRHLFQDRPHMVYINGEMILDPVYQVDYEKGILVFDQYLSDQDVVEMAYDFDGVEVIDDFHSNDGDVQYYGPPAQDYKVPSPPGNVSMVPIPEGMEIRYQVPEHKGEVFYYAVEARNELGSYSNLSTSFPISVQESVQGTVIEYSLDNGDTWEEAGTSTEDFYQDMKSDKEPPEGLTGIKTTVTANGDAFTVQLTWDTPVSNERIAMSPVYRVKTLLTNGQTSEGSAIVGPMPIQSSLDKIVILRTRASEVFPVYGDTSVETVAEIKDYNIGTHTHGANKGQNYYYSVFVVDKAGNHSIASTFIITT